MVVYFSVITVISGILNANRLIPYLFIQFCSILHFKDSSIASIMFTATAAGNLSVTCIICARLFTIVTFYTTYQISCKTQGLKMKSQIAPISFILAFFVTSRSKNHSNQNVIFPVHVYSMEPQSARSIALLILRMLLRN